MSSHGFTRCFARRALTSGIVCVLIPLCCTGVSFAQQGVDLDLNFLTGIPSGAFGDNVNNTVLGGSVFLGYHPAEKPIVIGADLEFFRYGKERRTELLSPDIPDLPVEVTNRNEMILAHLLIRIQPNLGEIAPYFDSMIGFNYLYTRTSLRGDRRYNDVISTTNFSDWALSYGLGGGIKIKVLENISLKAGKEDYVSLFVDLGMRYLFGSEAEYLKEGSIQRVSGDVYYNSNKSRTDLLQFKIGVSLMFRFSSL